MSDTNAEKAEARAIRRRWLNIGELVAVAGVIIAALSLWLTWSADKASEAERKAEKVAESQKATVVTFIGKGSGDTVTLNDANHTIASIDMTFPRVLGVPAQTAVLDETIRGDWFKEAVLSATDGGPDAVQGRLPVMIAATVTDGDKQSTSRAIYDVVFATEGGGLFGGRSLKLKGALLRERVSGDATARLDQLWSIEAKRLAELKKK